MKRIIRSASIILRAERLIAQRRMAIARKQLTLVAFAGLVAIVGVVMLNVSAYQALLASLGAPLAALLIALANFVLAGGMVLWAGKANSDSEIASVAEVRDLAIADLEAELEDMKDEVTAIVEDIRGIRRDPFGVMTSNLLLPLLTTVLKSLRDKE
ncbi:MAG: hypothetical protein ABJP33_05830 [Pseudoruegeria sp.]